MTAVHSVALMGLTGHVVEIEAWVGGGHPRTQLVGLPDAALSESQHRCRAAVSSQKLEWPDQFVTINLTPATLPKAGSHYDLGVAVAVLNTHASRRLPEAALSRTVLLGEDGVGGNHRLGLLRHRRLDLALLEHGFDQAIVPAVQLGEASLVKPLTIWGVGTLADVIEVLHGRPVLLPAVPDATAVSLTPRELESLRWTMEGKTAWEVGNILGITERTAVLHLNNATHKLDCVNKHQAVLKALRLKLIR